MQHIIEKIEIKNFRSFGNRKTKTQNKTEIFQLEKTEDLNIISGGNDSGKSNILRALNLFFNGKTDLGKFFNFKDDYHKKERDKDDVQEEVVTVKIWIHNPENKERNANNEKVYLPEKFWVARKWGKTSSYSQYTQESSIFTDFKKEKGEEYVHFEENDSITEKKIIKRYVQASLQKSLTNFLNSIKFHYVPAIKDKDFFGYLFGELQETLYKEEISKISTSQKSFEGEIQKETGNLMNEFKSVLNNDKLSFEPLFKLPENLVDVFRTLDVDTGNISLLFRGDGIQAKLIPEILNFISLKESKLQPRKIKKGFQRKRYFIWGFEEPENSYEYKNAQLLANRFLEIFSKNAQIFITTHSFNFLSLYSESLSLYRVYFDVDIKSTKIQRIERNSEGLFQFDSYRKQVTDINEDLLNDELGILELNTELKKIYTQYESKIQKLNEVIELSSLDEKVCILTEGSTDIEFLKILFNKYLEKWEDNYKFIDAKHGQSNSAESLKNLLLSLSAMNPNFKCLGIFDNDKVGKDICDNLNSIKMNQNTRYIILPELDWAKAWKVKLRLYDTESEIDLNGKALPIEMYFWELFKDEFTDIEKKFTFEQVPKLPDGIKNKLQDFIRNNKDTLGECEDGKKIIESIKQISF